MNNYQLFTNAFDAFVDAVYEIQTNVSSHDEQKKAFIDALMQNNAIDEVLATSLWKLALASYRLGYSDHENGERET